MVGTAFGTMYFFPDIDRLFTGGLALSEIVQKMYVGEPVVRVHWEAQDRVFAYQDVRPLSSSRM